jgi:hypothetical protein
MRAETGMKEAKGESKDSEKTEATPPPRPPVELHDPFDRFDFEPTDGGEF